MHTYVCARFSCAARKLRSRIAGDEMAGARDMCVLRVRAMCGCYVRFLYDKMKIRFCMSNKCSTFAPEIKSAMYRDPSVYVADIEVMTGKSYRTCQRILKKIREYYHLSKRQKPTIEQAKQYLTEIM